jgi:hypothetical protein
MEQAQAALDVVLQQQQAQHTIDVDAVNPNANTPKDVKSSHKELSAASPAIHTEPLPTRPSTRNSQLAPSPRDSHRFVTAPEITAFSKPDPVVGSTYEGMTLLDSHRAVKSSAKDSALAAYMAMLSDSDGEEDAHQRTNRNHGDKGAILKGTAVLDADSITEYDHRSQLGQKEVGEVSGEQEIVFDGMGGIDAGPVRQVEVLVLDNDGEEGAYSYDDDFEA